jgi:regulator of sigma E protease
LEILAIVPILGFLMIAHEFGHFIVAKRSGIVVEEFAIGFPPRLLSTERGGVRYSLNLIPFGAYVKMLGEEDPSAPGSFASQSKRVRAIVLAAGSGMNFLVAVAAFAIAYGTGWPEPVAQINIADVAAGSPAQVAGLQSGDVVVRVDGREVKNSGELRAQVLRSLDQPMQVGVLRGGQDITLTMTPRSQPPEGQGALGVRLQDRPISVEPVPHGPIESIAFGFRRTLDIIGLTFVAPVMAIRGEVEPDQVRPIGLPGMAQVAGQSARAAMESGWWFPVLLITGAFSAGLAVANMLPLPALDGGRLLFVLIEAIRGRRVSPEREGLIHFVGLAVLFSLMILISFNDLRSPLPAIDWGLR